MWKSVARPDLSVAAANAITRNESDADLIDRQSGKFNGFRFEFENRSKANRVVDDFTGLI